MIIETATIWAMSALIIMTIVVAVYFSVFFMILYVIGWAILKAWKPISKIIYHA